MRIRCRQTEKEFPFCGTGCHTERDGAQPKSGVTAHRQRPSSTATPPKKSVGRNSAGEAETKGIAAEPAKPASPQPMSTRRRSTRSARRPRGIWDKMLRAAKTERTKAEARRPRLRGARSSERSAVSRRVRWEPGGEELPQDRGCLASLDPPALDRDPSPDRGSAPRQAAFERGEVPLLVPTSAGDEERRGGELPAPGENAVHRRARKGPLGQGEEATVEALQWGRRLSERETGPGDEGEGEPEGVGELHPRADGKLSRLVPEVLQEGCGLPRSAGRGPGPRVPDDPDPQDPSASSVVLPVSAARGSRARASRRPRARARGRSRRRGCARGSLPGEW